MIWLVRWCLNDRHWHHLMGLVKLVCCSLVETWAINVQCGDQAVLVVDYNLPMQGRGKGEVRILLTAEAISLIGMLVSNV